MKELIFKTEKVINYLYVGSRKKPPPFVFLHGFTGNHHNWDEIILKLDRQAIVPDLPGHGKTCFKDVDDEYSIDEWCDDFYEILCLLNIDKIDLCGYSMGGRLAIAFASKHSSIINKLILESTSYGIESVKDKESRLKEDLESCNLIESDLPLFIEKWQKNDLFSMQEERNSEMFLRQHEQRLLNDPMQLSKALKSFGQGKMNFYSSDISEFKFPVTIINGLEDHRYIDIGKRLQALLTHSKQYTISKCGHNVHLERPHDFISILADL